MLLEIELFIIIKKLIYKEYMVIIKYIHLTIEQQNSQSKNNTMKKKMNHSNIITGDFNALMY